MFDYTKTEISRYNPINLVFKPLRDSFGANDLEFYYWQKLDSLLFRDQGDI